MAVCLQGVATFCKSGFTPVKCEEGLGGTLPSTQFEDAIGFREGIQDEFSPEELKQLDEEGRSILTLHEVEVIILKEEHRQQSLLF